nr:hypothetical protein BHI3_07750 [Bacteriovorax sp. HI3]
MNKLGKQGKRFASVLVILCVLIFSSCSRIPVKNSEWFLDLGDLGADSFWIFEGKERELSKEEWDKERYGMFCTLSDNYTNMVTAIETFCRQYNVCEKEFKKKLNNFKGKLIQNQFKAIQLKD